MNAVAKVDQQQKPQGVLATISSRYSMEPEVFKATVKGTVFPSTGTNEEFIAFLMVANEYRLNPIAREIYAFPKNGGGIVPIVSIDGWLSLINSHLQFDGMECEAGMQDGKLFAYTCRIYRKDRSRPIVVTEYLSECKRETIQWQMPHRMLRHKAVMQCARYAFGFSGVYDEDEGRDIAESARDITPPTPPTPQAQASAAQPAKPVAGEVIEPKRKVESPPVEVAAPPKQEPVQQADVTDIEDPNQIIAELIDALSVANTTDAIEEGYDVADFEARLSQFNGYVERARQIKAQHLQRVEAAAARAAAVAPTPPAPSGALEDDPAPPSPEVSKGGLVTLEDYRAFALGSVVKYTDASKIEAWWKETRETRQKLDMPAEMRAEIQNALQKRMGEIASGQKA